MRSSKDAPTETLTIRRGGGPSRFNGHGTFDDDRPPILGVIGRASAEVFLRQLKRVGAP